MNVMYQDNSKNINLEDIRQILKVISDLISKPSRYMLNKFKSNPNNQYINKEYNKQEEHLTKDDKIKYELILGFRKINGINKKEFYNKYNINLLDINKIKELIDKEYLIEDNDNIYINNKYIYVSNDILVNFI